MDYIILNDVGDRWHNEEGWSSRYTIFTEREKETFNLPIGGRWVETKVSCPMECPTCGAQEIANPEAAVTDWRWNIKPFRVDHWSKCLVCEREGREPWF
jgi:hypothetical protein